MSFNFMSAVTILIASEKQENHYVSLQKINHTMQRRQWHPTPVPLPGKSHGRRSLVGCSPWGHEESDTTERPHFHFSLSCIGEGNGNPLRCSSLENPKGRGSLMGCCLWGRTELDTTEATWQQQQQQTLKKPNVSLFCKSLHLFWVRMLEI